MPAFKKVDCPRCRGTGKVEHIDGARLRKLRMRAGVSIRDLAVQLALSPAYLSDIELGKKGYGSDAPRLAALIKSYERL